MRMSWWTLNLTTSWTTLERMKLVGKPLRTSSCTLERQAETGRGLQLLLSINARTVLVRSFSSVQVVSLACPGLLTLPV